MAAAAGSVAAEAVSPLFIRVVVDQAVDGVTRDLTAATAALAALAVAGFAAGAARRYLGGRLSLDVQHDLRRAVFRAAIRFDGPQQDAMRTGQVVARALTDLQRVQGLLSTAPAAIGYVVLIAVSLGAMVWLSPLLSLVAVVVLAASGVLTVQSRRALFPATWSAQQRIADIAQHVEETVAGVRVVKAFGQETREVRELDRRARWLYRDRLRVARITARLAPPLAVMPVLGLVAVFAVGGVLALHGSLTIGTFLAFSAYITNLVLPMRVIGGLVVSAQLARAGTERVYDIVDARPAVADPVRPDRLPGGPLGVEFDAVTFGYAPGQLVLDGVSFTVEPGETVALVGTAGAGKSTLIQLVPRFYDPRAGEVRVGGLPVRQLRTAGLRKEIGSASEEAFLFGGTISDAISYGQPDATPAEMRQAARAAGAEEFISRLPDGYDTVVGDRGLTLSGGQRQRIALARALLFNPRILLLDDPASAVDARTEQAMHDGLRAAMAGRTTILVARRRTTLALADRIVVLGAGRVLDMGTEAELDARGSLAAVMEGLPGAEAGRGAARPGRRGARAQQAVPRMMRVYGLARELVSEVNTDLQENVAGVRTVQSFVREDLSQARFDARSAAYRAARLQAQRWIAVYFPLIELICDLALVAVLAAGARDVAARTLSPGVLTAFLLYLQLFFTPLQTLSQLFDGYQQARVGLRRIGGLLRIPAEPPTTSLASGEPPVPVRGALRGDIELRGVTFRYQGTSQDVLADVSLRIRAGETVALVGATGAGKSTLVKLLGRYYEPTAGQILVDGVDVRRYPREEFRQRLGVVPQEPYLFSGNIAANIGYGRPDAAPEPILEAARAVGALEMIAGLPGGFGQPVGERGQGLSAGQRQLIALARAALVDPDLVLLDEATAALDPGTESAVVRATARLTRGPRHGPPGRRRTTVLVAHRLATAARADRIVVLAAGRVVEQGTHAELLDRDGHYSAFWRAGTLAGDDRSAHGPLTASTAG
jgi:ABC-type multidrug transport system fused ATPase/permease subunit